jgi:SAM-dependent methyltransferase
MANAAQIEVWNDANAKRWLRLRGALAAMLSPYGDEALQALDPRAGEFALDVGCGFGDTTVALARRTGRALGVDVSEPFIEVARREAAHGAGYLVADAQTHFFEEKFDLLYSRFGVMFFDDPVAAFRNLAGALRPGARVGAAVWGPFQQNTWASVPLGILRRQLAGPSTPPPGPGAFSLSDRGRLSSLLLAAGFTQVSITPMELGRRTEPSLLLESGPVTAALREAGEAGQRLRPQLEAEIAQALPDGVRAVALLVSAVRP